MITLFGIFIPDILFMFNFLGGFCAACICFMAPALILLKTESRTRYALPVFIIATLLTALGFTAVGISVNRLIYDDTN